MEPQQELFDQFPFLRDPSLSDELKKFLIEKSIQREAAAWSNQLEIKKWRWSTPLAIALTGIITIAANFLVSYWTATQKQIIDTANADAEARRKNAATEREFEYKIVERELGQDKPESKRAEVLLFLVRAGVLNGLNASELKDMAEAALRKEGKAPNSLGIPSLGGDFPVTRCNQTNDAKIANDTVDLGGTQLQVKSCVHPDGSRYRYYYTLKNLSDATLNLLMWADAGLSVEKILPGDRPYYFYRFSNSPPELSNSVIQADKNSQASLKVYVPSEKPLNVIRLR